MRNRLWQWSTDELQINIRKDELQRIISNQQTPSLPTPNPTHSPRNRVSPFRRSSLSFTKKQSTSSSPYQRYKEQHSHTPPPSNHPPSPTPHIQEQLNHFSVKQSYERAMRHHYDPHLIGSLRQELVNSPKNLLGPKKQEEHCSNYFRAVKGKNIRRHRIMPPIYYHQE